MFVVLISGCGGGGGEDASESASTSVAAAAWIWGGDISGELGRGSAIFSPEPVQVPGLSGVLSVSTLNDWTLALLSDGTVRSWGRNTYGQLGNGSLIDSSTPVNVTGLTGVVAVSAGSRFAAALRSDGTVWTWGHNNWGQLGIGNSLDRSTPGPVPGLSGVVAIATGEHHTVALLSDGTMQSWGWNHFGQVGNVRDGSGSLVWIQSTPAPVVDAAGAVVSSIVAVAAGSAHNLVLKSNGTGLAWGWNRYGQLGNNVTNSEQSPNPIAGPILSNSSGTILTNILRLAGGDGHSLALLADGSVRSWGRNNLAQLGNVTYYNAYNALGSVYNLSAATSIGTGAFHSFAIQTDGTVRGWGKNDYLQLGIIPLDPTYTSAAVVYGLIGKSVSSVDAGAFHSVAVLTDGTVWIWGSNRFGEYGNGRELYMTEPLSLSAIADGVSIAAGGEHTLVATPIGTVLAWGENESGQLGNGTTYPGSTPAPVPGLASVKSVAAGTAHSLALRTDGTVRAWGHNGYGQLGNGLNIGSFPDPVPGPVSNLSGVAAIAAGGYHSFAILSDGTVLGWGYNNEGQVGDSTYELTRVLPVSVVGLTNVVAIKAGYSHSVALCSDGTVWTWGGNGYGQLGNGTTDARAIPALVTGLADVVGIAAGTSFTAALRKDGTLWTWGRNDTGQLGLGTTDNQATPIQVTGLSGVGDLSAGEAHMLVLLSDGTVRAWGKNQYGQLGDGTTVSRFSPISLPNLSGVTKIAAGGIHSIAVR